MYWWGTGFIPIIIYAAGGNTALNQNAILTENNFDILTEGSDTLLTEA